MNTKRFSSVCQWEFGKTSASVRRPCYADVRARMVFTGSHGRYQWLVDDRDGTGCGNGIGHLIRLCPETLLGRYLVVTSIDSGPLQPNAEETSAGWCVDDRLAYSPRLESLSLLPYEGYDEWYLFTSPAKLSSCDVFINFGGFTLRSPEESLAELDPTWDCAGAKALADEQGLQQSRFWTQLESFGAESYIADGDNFVFATANADLFARVETAFRSA